MLIIVSGPMFAGKTTWLLDYASKLPQGTYKLFKPNIDSRYADDKCVTHDGMHLPSLNLNVENPQFTDIGDKIKTILIDELNFFNSDKLIPVINKQLKLKKTIVGAGLNFDYQKVPFGSTIPLTKIADQSIELFSVCDKCGGKARHVYRKIQNENRIFLGAADAYGTSCEVCWEDLSKN